MTTYVSTGCLWNAEAGPLEGDDDPSLKVRRKAQREPLWTNACLSCFADLDFASRALLLSQSGAGASCALTVLPTGPDFVVPSEEFRVLLLRRLRLALPLAPKAMPVWRRLDSLGDHRSACAQVGVLAHRAGPLERAAARICREAGVRVATRVALLRELNLDVPPLTAGGLRSSHGVPLWRGAQIAVDTTLVRPVQPLAPGRAQRWHFNKPRRASSARTPSRPRTLSLGCLQKPASPS